jgi:hypothetical protein
MAAAAPALLGGAALGGAIGQLISGRSAERQSEREGKRRDRAVQGQIGALNDQNAATLFGKAELAARQRRLAGAGLGQRDTLLTGPSGISNTAPGDTGQRKTLLGL